MLIKRLGFVLVFIAACGIACAAQENPDTSSSGSVRLIGSVRTASNIPVPAATLRVIHASTGKAWISWTDENGKFEFPDLPSGHFRLEASQLGFAPLTKEFDLSGTSAAPLDLKLDVATLASLSSPAAASENAAKAPEATPQSGVAKLPSASAPAQQAPGNSEPQPPTEPSAAGNPGGGYRRGAAGGRFGGGGGQAGGQGGGQFGGPGGGARGFQQVELGASNNGNTNGNNEDVNPPENESAGNTPEEGALGQSASSDAMVISGTVARAASPDFSMMAMVVSPGQGDLNPSLPPGFGGQGGPGGGFAGPGGPGGGPGGPDGGPVIYQRAGGGGGRGRAARIAPGGPQGVASLWGAQRVMKQRLNRVHFSVYDTFGDTALNARPYSLTVANPPKINGWNDTAGFNMGGPLKIPHIYDGTDKTFFFINFSGSWSRNPVDSFATVPTLAERAGDFSADNAQLFNPLSNPSGPRTLMPNAGCLQDAANAAGTCIPQGMINQTALNLLNYVPSPNLPGRALNFHLQTNLPGLSNRLNVNLNHQISSKLSLLVNYNLSNAISHSLNSFPGVEGNTSSRGQSVMLGLIQNYSRSFLHMSQFYFSRNRILGLNEFSNLTDISSQLGVTGVSSSPFDFGLPQINFTNLSGLNDPIPSRNRSQTYRYVDTVRWMKEKHTISVGGEIRKMDINRETDPTPNGQFSFTGLLTSQLTSSGAPVPSPANCGPANPAVPCIGNDFADFLLGYPANTRIQFGDSSTYFRSWGYAGYASDDWHVVPKFTVTFGLRYEAFTPPTEINNHIANLAVSPDFTQVQCVTPVAFANCAAGPTQSLFHGHYNNWAPRIGIAWQPPGKWFNGKHQMTVRAGYSMFYVESYLNTLASEMANQPPFAVANTLVNTANSTNSAPSLSLQNGFPAGAVSSNTLTNTIAVNPNYQVPYAMIWNASVEYNLMKNTFVEVMYTGTRGVHLDELLGFSLANPLQAGTVRNASGFTYDTTGGFSNFNALQLRLQRRMTRGFMFMARYTYSKSLDDASSIGGGGQTVIQNNADPRGDYGLSSFDMRHQFLANFTYQLPFGERRRFATKGWQKTVFGAWRVNSSFTAHSGTPYTVRVFSTNPACQNVPGVNSERADQTGSAALASPSVLQWFNTSAFSPPAGCLGDAPRNSVLGPGAFTMNSGVTKTFQFGRDGLRRLDFSWNTSNLLNHVNYTGLSTVFGSPTFGQITGAGPMRTMTFTTRVNF